MSGSVKGHTLSLAAVLLGTAPVHAEPLWHATRTIAVGEILGSGDVELREEAHPRFGALPLTRSPVGLEAKRRIAFGRVVIERDVGRPSLVHANAPVRAIWHSPGIDMELQARALESGAVGETIRLLNTMTSRTIRGVVLPDGSVAVAGAP
jgi:flagella basal body P-ring formation protein FlgA